MNAYPTVRSLEELDKATTTFIHVICPKCGSDYTSMKENARKTLTKGCVICTMGTEDEWQPSMEIITKDVSPQGIRPELLEFMLECESVLRKHDLIKGDSWKTMTLNDLYYLLATQIQEWQNTCDPKELINITNVTMMLWNRMQGAR